MAGSPLRIFSDGNFSVNINNKNRNQHTDLLLGMSMSLSAHIGHSQDFFLDNSGLKVHGGLFELRDETDRVLFSLSSGQTVIGSDKVRLTGSAGLSVK